MCTSIFTVKILIDHFFVINISITTYVLNMKYCNINPKTTVSAIITSDVHVNIVIDRYRSSIRVKTIDNSFPFCHKCNNGLVCLVIFNFLCIKKIKKQRVF